MKRERTVFRQLDGILLLDKPAGMSSNQALQRVRHIFRAEKAGHTGSLDPLATGLLPLCFGEATKIAGHLLGNDKAYEVEAKLGATTDTDDADGAVLRERAVPTLERRRVEDELTKFIGRILQRPPIYSALKQGGEPLYAKARRGEAIEVPEREVEVRAIELLDLAPDTLRLRVECGTGTYIRSIVRDLGEALGCGAHVTMLRRLWVSPFATPAMHGIEHLQRLRETNDEAGLDALLLPLEAGLAAWPRLPLDRERSRALGHGQVLRLDAGEQAAFEKAHSGGFEALAVGPDAVALGLVEVGDDGFVRAKRLFRWAALG